MIKRLQSRCGVMKNARSPYLTHWQEINQFVAPNNARFQTTDRDKGGKRTNDIINETVLFSRRTFKSGLMAGMSSPARPWFLLAPPDPGMKEFGPVKEWLDTVTRLMRDVFVRSNLYGVLPTIYGSCGDYGTAAFGLQEDDKETIRCYPFSTGSYMIDCNERMQVDTLYREYTQTVRQLVSRFGLEKCSLKVRTAWDRGDYGTWVDVVHAIEPNFARIPGKLNARDKAYLSVTYEAGEKTPLNVSGFDDFPALAPRWSVNGEDVYGTDCPGMVCLGSQKGMQFSERKKYQAVDKLVNPAMNGDATLRNAGADLLPGGVNWIPGMSNGNPGLRPIHELDYRTIEILGNDIKEVEERVRRAYYEDLMMLLANSDRPQMTAEEVRERSQEKLLVLGPLMEQFNDDLFDPLIDRVFNIMLRRGQLPPPPEELQGQSLRVEYVSIMAQAQKLIGVAAIERFVGFVGNLVAVAPDAMDKVDLDQAIDEYAEMTGVSAKIVRSDDVVAQQRQARQEAAQAQQMAQMAPAMAQGANAVKTLSETNVQDVSALTRLMTGMG